MNSARIEDAPAATASMNIKRGLAEREGMREHKQRRTTSTPAEEDEMVAVRRRPSMMATTDELARKGLRRGITLVLDALGFDAASEEALEGFATMVETYLTSLVEDVSTFARASRRSCPIPTDFEMSLRRFNVDAASLKPHLRPPVPRPKRVPGWVALALEDQLSLSLHVLGAELSGAPEKEARKYIPQSFPSFPSIHTFRYTPRDVEAVTVSDDWGIYDPDQASQTLIPGQSHQSHQSQSQTRPLPPSEIPRGDPKKIREAAAKEAKAGEEALRRLMRASKIAKQKEVWTTAQREPHRRERYELWEAAMRELIEDDARASGRDIAPGAVHGAMGRFEIADHSMIVNAEGRFNRKEVPRASRRKVGNVEAGKS